MEDLVTMTSAAVPAIQAVAPTPALPPQPTRIPSTTIRTVAAVDDVTAQRFYALYLETFGELAIRAVNRHLLRREEFMSVMVDPRIDKIVIEDDESGELIAMCTLTNHLETVDWVSPQYYAHHYRVGDDRYCKQRYRLSNAEQQLGNANTFQHHFYYVDCVFTAIESSVSLVAWFAAAYGDKQWAGLHWWSGNDQCYQPVHECDLHLGERPWRDDTGFQHHWSIHRCCEYGRHLWCDG